MSNYFLEKYGDPDWGKMKQPHYPELVRDAIARHPDADTGRLLNIIMSEQHGATNPNAVSDEIKRQKTFEIGPGAFEVRGTATRITSVKSMSDLILPTEEQVERAARLLDEAFQPCYGPLLRSEARKFLVLLLNKDKILGDAALTAFDEGRAHERLMSQRPRKGVSVGGVFVPTDEPSPIALTEDHVASLERAIRAEGYDIKVDTETGEIKLYRERQTASCGECGLPISPYGHSVDHNGKPTHLHCVPGSI